MSQLLVSRHAAEVRRLRGQAGVVDWRCGPRSPSGAARNLWHAACRGHRLVQGEGGANSLWHRRADQGKIWRASSWAPASSP